MELAEIVALIVATAFGGGGAAWAGVKAGLNGARADIAETKQIVKEVRSEVNNLNVRVTVLEHDAEHRS